MRRVLFDTSIVMDVLLDREPYVAASAAAWAAAESGAAEGLLAEPAVTTLHYLAAMELGAAKARHVVSDILTVFRVAALDSAVLDEALHSPYSDFEDAITAAAARLAGCDFIVTRDPKRFRASPIRAFTPEAVLPLLQS